MSSKTKIIVLHMKEVVYTTVFLALAILLLVVFLIMFGSGKKESAKKPAAGILAGNSVLDVVCQVMEQNGYDFSRRKPCDVATYAQQTWDYVITLCPEAEEVQKEMQGVVRKYVSFNFTDPFQGGIHEDEQEERVRALYDIMHKELYEFFRSELMEKLLPRCSCGANTYCRCE